jgi:glycosyltransferase A (GT-A) superfamily protein (DUF2064 family)
MAQRATGGWAVGEEATLQYARGDGLVARTRGARAWAGLQTVQLNAVGWLVLLVPALLLGVALGAVTGSPVVGAAAAGAVLVGWWLLDRRRHRRSGVHVSWNLGEAATRRVVERLRQQGIDATLEPPLAEVEELDHWAVDVQQRHLRKAEAALAAEREAAPPG